jgi:hypothetical protein
MTLLLLTQPGHRANTYGPYAAEVLKTEGFSDLAVQPIDSLGDDAPGALDRYDAVVLTPSLPRRSQVDALVAYVRAGGRLLALRPSRLLASALGLVPTDTVTSPAYVKPAADHPIGAGLPQESLQTHVPADNYEPARLPPGTRSAARLYAGADTPASFPACLHIPLDQGQAVLFTYDLPRAVALIRQGDPALADWRTVGYGAPYRPNELFTGWLDPARAHLPQADLHATLLGNAVNAVARAPQPRFWYYPTPAQKSVVVLDSDDDWSAPEHFDALLAGVERHGGHITVYLMMGPTRKTIATPDKVAAWRARGHSFGIHHNAGDPRYAEEEQDAVIEDIVRRDVATFRDAYGSVPLTNRNHCLYWKGYVDLPRLYAELGVTMDLNYLSLFQFWQTYLTGSARPARFVDTSGEVLDCFQQATIAFDDASVKSRLASDPLGEAATTRRLMEANVTRSFGALSMLSHPVSFFTYSSAYMDEVWRSARELGIPIWSAFEWADFVRARDGASIAAPRWQDGRFTCRLAGTSPRGSLTLMLPFGGTDRGSGDGVDGDPGPGEVRAEVDGEPVPATTQVAFGWRYALVPVPLDPARRLERDVSVGPA